MKREMERVKWEKQKSEREMKRKMAMEFKEHKEWKKVREIEEQQLVQTTSKRHVSQDARERIRQREEEIVARKRLNLEMKEVRKLEQEWKEEKLREKHLVKLQSIESKVTQETVAAQQHRRDKFNRDVDQPKYADTLGGQLIPKKLIPLWRQK